MKKVTLLYSCNVHHEHSSRFLHGAYSSVDAAIDGLREMLEHTDEQGYNKLSAEQEGLLRRINQTQGYDGPGEFILQTLEVDTLDVNL